MTWCDLGNPFNEILRRGLTSVEFDSAPYPPPPEALLHVALLFTYDIDSRIKAIVFISLRRLLLTQSKILQPRFRN